MYNWTEYREIRKKWFGENRLDSKKNYKKYKEMFSFPSIGPDGFRIHSCDNTLASKPAVPSKLTGLKADWIVVDEIKEEGINPMSYTTTYTYAPTASAAIVNPQTETDKQREYLLQRLKDVYYSNRIRDDLRKMFHIDVSNAPKNFKELIEKIEKKQYKIDKHAAERIEDEDFEDDFWGPLDGIIWDGPKADYDAYNKAERERDDAYNAAKDQIWINTPQDALKAIEDFKNWKPSNAPKN